METVALLGLTAAVFGLIGYGICWAIHYGRNRCSVCGGLFPSVCHECLIDVDEFVINNRPKFKGGIR